MTPEQLGHQLGQLQQQVHALQTENEQLRHQLAHQAQQSQTKAERQKKMVRGGGRLLIPLLDRHKVVRSFGKLAETAGNFTGPREQWPTRDDVLGDARIFMESLVRFAIRRRTLMLVLMLFGAVIPGIQLWLVVQQNEIIEKQNEIITDQLELSELQIYDVISRSMTEGDRNAKLVTSALLSRAKPEFLARVIDEAFDPVLMGSYGQKSYNATHRRLEDAAFRGHLVRAAVKGIGRLVEEAKSTEQPLEPVATKAIPTLQRILQDSALRVPEVLRLGKSARADDDRKGSALDEEVEGYLRRVGEAIQLYARLARTSGRTDELARDLRPLMRRVDWDDLAQNRYRRANALVFEMLLLDFAVQPPPEASLEVEPEGERDQALTTGLQAMRDLVGEDSVDWDRVASEVRGG